MTLEQVVAHWIDLGEISYEEAFNMQETLAEDRKQDLVPDTILVCSHPSTIDFGAAKSHNSFSPEFLAEVAAVYGEPTHENALALLEERGFKFNTTSRGGGATYLGPGQLNFYPVVDFERISGKLNIGGYKNKLDEIMHDVLTRLGVNAKIVKVARELGEPEDVLRGDRRDVWVQRNGTSYKLGGKGIHTSGRVSYHGFNFYLDPRCRYGFSLINACGYPKSVLDVTTIQDELGQPVAREQIKQLTLRSIKDKFGYSSFNQVSPRSEVVWQH